MTRREIHFSGHVQGVGFRYTTKRLAAGFDVTGYVQNLSDGRVRIVAEGTNQELDRFVERVESTMDGYITNRETSELPTTDEFDRFDILR